MKKNYLSLFKGKRKYLFYYVCGLVDGEGKFSVFFKKDAGASIGWLVDPVFQVRQHQSNIDILYLLKEAFGAGSIYKKSGKDSVMIFEIRSRRSLEEKIVSFFKKYPLIAKKRSFKIFCEILELMKRKEHLKKKGIKRIYKLAKEINPQEKGRKYSLKDFD